MIHEGEDVWETIRLKWGAEYHELWPALLERVHGDPLVLLRSRREIRERWPGLLLPYGEDDPKPRYPLWRRVKRAWRVLVGTA